jgi:hypothetical protein
MNDLGEHLDKKIIEWNDGTSRVKRKSSRVSKKDRKCEELVL